MSDRRLDEDFYRCPNTGRLIYKWQDDRFVLQPEDDVERAKKIEAAANAALGYVVGDVAYQRLAAALTPDPAPTVTEAMGSINEAVKESKPAETKGGAG